MSNSVSPPAKPGVYPNEISPEDGARPKPFGETWINTGSEDYKFKFTGKELDPESGLYDYGARYYDPVLGRFISPDAIVPSPTNPQALNRYSYCYNNPLAYTDPTGHFPWLLALGAVALGAGAGASIAAISGGDIGMGAFTGAISAAAFFTAGQGIAALGLVTKAGAYTSAQAFLAGSAIHAATGVATGAINAAITGGDVGMGALTGGISGGMGHFLGSGIPRLSNPVANFGVHLTGRSLIGGVSGGIAAELYGGSFGQGFGQGAWTAGFGYTFNCAFPLVAYGLYQALVYTGIVTSAIYTGLVVGHYMNEGGANDPEAVTEEGVTEEVIKRGSPGADGGESQHVVERKDGEAISVTHQVGRGGKIIHQHQTHIGKHGTTRVFPDEWVKYPRR